jgi:2'-5' RNA ligase
MKAAVALLSDYKIQNIARHIAFELERDYGIDFLACLLPAHVSLKQPFAFESMEQMEGYFDSLAASLAPFRIELDELYCTNWEGFGILGMNVKETGTLRDLHARLNRELGRLCKDPSAPHDGDEYRFHLTIEMGKVTETDPYREYFDRLANKTLDLSFQAEEIALFYYSGKEDTSFINYKVLPLTG